MDENTHPIDSSPHKVSRTKRPTKTCCLRTELKIMLQGRKVESWSCREIYNTWQPSVPCHNYSRVNCCLPLSLSARHACKAAGVVLLHFSGFLVRISPGIWLVKMIHSQIFSCYFLNFKYLIDGCLDNQEIVLGCTWACAQDMSNKRSRDEIKLLADNCCLVTTCKYSIRVCDRIYGGQLT